MDKYIQDWERNQDRNPSVPAALMSEAACEPQADPDVRKDCAKPMDAEEEGRGQKRAASESQASPKSTAPAAATQQ